MAQIVELRRNESPPGEIDCVVVIRDSSGHHTAEGGFVEHSRGATFYVPYLSTEEDRAAVLAKAQAWADKHGITTVYVQD